jgi:hypothetical protein
MLAEETGMKLCRKNDTCAAGRYFGVLYDWRTGLHDKTGCVRCPISKFQTKPGQWKCLACPLGRIASQSRWGCIPGFPPCPKGKFHPHRDDDYRVLQQPSGDCITCLNPRKYRIVDDNTYCTESRYYCNAGEYHKGADLCEKCPTNSFSTGQDPIRCKACPMGYFQLLRGMKHCSQNFCKAGEVMGDLFVCKQCPAAQYSAAGSLVCRGCPRGTYQYKTGQGSCSASECLPGERQGKTACDKCPPDTYQDMAGQSMCKPCESDGVSVGGTAKCFKRCGVGKELTTTGCKACPGYLIATYQKNPGRSACLTCKGLPRGSKECPLSVWVHPRTCSMPHTSSSQIIILRL